MTTLIELFPDIGQAIIATFAEGRPGLADAVPTLAVVDRCRCEDAFCATVYTVPPPEKAWGPGLRDFRIKTDDGSIIVLDVVRGRIACVEVLFREGARGRLLAVCP